MKDVVFVIEDNCFYEYGVFDYKCLFGVIGKNLIGGFGFEGVLILI